MPCSALSRCVCASTRSRSFAALALPSMMVALMACLSGGRGAEPSNLEEDVDEQTLEQHPQKPKCDQHDGGREIEAADWRHDAPDPAKHRLGQPVQDLHDLARQRIGQVE